MPRDIVAVTALVLNDGVASPAGTVIVPGNGIVIPAGGDTGDLVVRITHTDNLVNDATFDAPTDNPAALRAGIGDLVEEFAAGDGTPVTKYFVIESSRFSQVNGDIYVDFEADFTGTIAAARLPFGA